MGRIFGTDGARGIANTEISCQLAMNIGRAACMVMAERLGTPPTFLIGMDTRISSPMLESAVSVGIVSVGGNVIQLGVVPTPAVAYLTSIHKGDAGIMISASHNSYEFNGIKLFGPSGYKLTDEEEHEIEEIILDSVKPYSIRWGSELGTISQQYSWKEIYNTHIASTVPSGFSEYRVLLDCSNGSASATAKEIFEKIGATVELMYAHPDGININEQCGSTHVEQLAQYVKSNPQYDVAFAFDGDADRCLAVDETGQVVDGDRIMAILALDMKRRGCLKDDTLVATVMSNLGLFHFANKEQITVEKTKVGDRYVLQKMLKKGYNLGGEQSGHVILSDYMMTGDGELTAVQLLNTMKNTGKKLSELASVMNVYPQVLRNLYADAPMKASLDVDAGAIKLLEDAQKALGDSGRVLVRASGTEPLIRVMIEGEDQKQIEEMADELSERLQERLNFCETFTQKHTELQ